MRRWQLEYSCLVELGSRVRASPEYGACLPDLLDARSHRPTWVSAPKGPSWSSLDYGGGWKLGHHFARRF